ncbi:MAG: DEAD/DEAH box helicase [Chlamydiota bacterium]|nr:DEAD/DEAH box helicase [Chlamydiota bacterium]
MLKSQHSSFHGLGIAPKLLEILNKNQYTIPTPIQHQLIPHALEGKDLIGIAQTGTGKTLAFGIPMLQRLAQQYGLGLILVPTRELALQVDEAIQIIGRHLGLKTAVLIGGEPIFKQFKRLRMNPSILIATPGRLIDHLEQKSVKLDPVSILVLDEADRMLDMGFAPQINKILVHVPSKRQTMLFSATMPKEIVSIAAKHMKLPVRVEVAPAGTMAEDVTQELFFVDKPNKLNLLGKVLSEYRGSVLIFTRTKFEAKRLAGNIRGMGHSATEIHSNRSLPQRREAMQGFRVGKYRVLVATDIAARGIDVSGIELVLNYDLPDNPEDYVHRIGRTGRAGLVGHAISFAAPHQRGDVRSIERFTRKNLPITKTPNLPAIRMTPKPEHVEKKPRDQHRRRFKSRKSSDRKPGPTFYR